jgi:hypothetical protein
MPVVSGKCNKGKLLEWEERPGTLKTSTKLKDYFGRIIELKKLYDKATTKHMFSKLTIILQARKWVMWLP